MNNPDKSGLEGLFEDEMPAVEGSADTADVREPAAGQDLSDLFEEEVEPIGTTGAREEEKEEDLSDLFDETPAERGTAHAAKGREKGPDVLKTPGQNAPAVHFKATMVAEENSHPEGSGSGKKSDMSAPIPTGPAPSEAAPDEAESTEPAGRGEHGAGLELAPDSAREQDATPEHEAAAETLEKRLRWRTEMERLWPSVEQVLRIAGASAALDPVRKSMQLTQDPQEDAEQRERLMAALRPEVASSSAVEAFRSREDIDPVTRFVYDEVLGISVLGDLWRDPDITEIMVDSWDRIVVEKNGKLHLTERTFHSPDHASSIARALALRISDRAVSNAIPLVTAELPQARVTIAYGPVVKGGLSITIRKFRKLLGLEGLREMKALDENMVNFLEKAVRARATILVSGGTGAGKTTIVNLLSAFIPDAERVITIEDAFELQLSNTHVVSLQTKEAASADDTVSVTLAELLRGTLRMRPDRVVVGEIREPEAAEVMLAAANTGHAGTMTTIHANSAQAALNERLVDLLLQMRPGNEASVRRTIAEAFDLVVQVSRAKDGSRYISEIAVVTGISDTGRITTATLFAGSGDIASRNFIHTPAKGRAKEVLDLMMG